MTGLNILRLIDISLKKKIDGRLICTPFVASKLQLVVVLTKGVQNPTFNYVVSKLGMEDIFTPT